MSAFIQDGQTTCKVALTLCNSPKDEAFAYNQYGKTITVERTIRRQGASSYRLLNWKKEVVSRTADEVTRLKDHYFVQVDNPCSVLGQDDAKALTDGTDEFKYKFYLRASGLQMVLDQLCYCTDARRQLEDILNRQTRDLQEKKTELEACEREYEAAGALPPRRVSADGYRRCCGGITAVGLACRGCRRCASASAWHGAQDRAGSAGQPSERRLAR